MSVTVTGYAQTAYPTPTYPAIFPLTAGAAAAMANPAAPTPVFAQPFNQPDPTTTLNLGGKPHPTAPDTSQRLKSLAKAVALITPAILLAQVKPSKQALKIAAKEVFPSDWKVWAKIGLGIASINQAQKALNWNPPPWLSGFMNVSIMAALMTGFTRNSAKTIAVLGPWVAALVQGTHYADHKLEKPLAEKYNIPPWATKLALAIASMGTGFVGLPKIMALAEPEAEAANARALSTGSCGCCGGSPICFSQLSQLSNNATLAMTQVGKHFNPDHRKEPPQ